ncbi:MAG: GNAT family N-acetyltransferase [Promethearchaeota archaeon]
MRNREQKTNFRPLLNRGSQFTLNFEEKYWLQLKNTAQKGQKYYVAILGADFAPKVLRKKIIGGDLMASKAEAKEIKSVPKYRCRDLREDDADKIVRLYHRIYNGNYPLEEYQDPEWIKAQVGNPNKFFKVFEDNEDTIFGCGVLDFDPDKGTLFALATVIDPDYQGRGAMSGVGMETLRQIIKAVNGKVKILYGTARMVPKDAKMQRIMEKNGFRPIGFLPDLDTGVGTRESEIFEALIFTHAFKNRRKNPIILPEIENVIKAVKKQYRQVKEYRVEAVDEISIPHNGIQVGTFEDIHEYYTYITVSCGQNFIKIEIIPKAESAEIIEYNCENPEIFGALILKIINKLEVRNIKYLGAYVNAYEPAQQKIFLQTGFKATGYIPIFDKVDGVNEDRVLMVWIPGWANGGMITRSIEFSANSWALFQHFKNDIGLEGTVTELNYGQVRFDMS